MKEVFYKTNGSIDVESGLHGEVVVVWNHGGCQIFTEDEIVFLRRCFTEILEG